MELVAVVTQIFDSDGIIEWRECVDLVGAISWIDVRRETAGCRSVGWSERVLNLNVQVRVRDDLLWLNQRQGEGEGAVRRHLVLVQ